MSEDETVNANSLLDRLKCPDLSRKRKIRSNPPPTGKKWSNRGKVAAEPGIAPSQRVKEFPNECFSITLGKLFCRRKPFSEEKCIV